MQGMIITMFLIFSKLGNAKTDKFHNAKFVEIDGNSNLYNSETILKVALESCIEACKATKECRYINYHEDSQACHFIGVQGENGSITTHNPKKENGYTFGNKSEWKMERYNVCSKCENYGSCRRENLQTDMTEKYSLCRSSGCGPPPVFTGSNIRGNMFSIGNKVLYECKPDYVLNGGAVSTCREDGTWSLTVPVCLPDCGEVQASIGYGTVTLDEPTRTTAGATATVNCQHGYEFKQTKITCLTTGTWEIATCTRIKCECYHWTPEDLVAIGEQTLENRRQQCLNLGNVFAQGNDNECPGCGGCYCCRPL